ncbi:hypothetical protein PR048_004162 [Dryococelus australis]|uniref:Uncharacterized protein n=1 Tax=Dryococelus australis TaxID=614101 RepID=A0ABQ9I4P7_9NEOP|nr:hypothetical protein PR048_004162 [Dryococelus australis]
MRRRFADREVIDSSRTFWSKQRYVASCGRHNCSASHVRHLRDARNRIRLGRASQKQSSDTHKTPYDRVKRCRERIIYIKASERFNSANRRAANMAVAFPEFESAPRARRLQPDRRGPEHAERRNAGAEETRDPYMKFASNSGIVWHNFHLAKIPSGPVSPWWEASRLTAQPPRILHLRTCVFVHPRLRLPPDTSLRLGLPATANCRSSLAVHLDVVKEAGTCHQTTVAMAICSDDLSLGHQRPIPTLFMLPEADSKRRLTTAGHTHLHAFLVRCPDDKRRRSQVLRWPISGALFNIFGPVYWPVERVFGTVFREVLLQSRSCPGSLFEGVIRLAVQLRPDNFITPASPVSLLVSHLGRVQPPARPLQDVRMWDSCRTMPLVGGFSRGSPIHTGLSFRCCSILTLVSLIGPQYLAVKSRPNLFTHSLACSLSARPAADLAPSSGRTLGGSNCSVNNKLVPTSGERADTTFRADTKLGGNAAINTLQLACLVFVTRSPPTTLHWPQFRVASRACGVVSRLSGRPRLRNYVQPVSRCSAGRACRSLRRRSRFRAGLLTATCCVAGAWLLSLPRRELITYYVHADSCRPFNRRSQGRRIHVEKKKHSGYSRPGSDTRPPERTSDTLPLVQTRSDRIGKGSFTSLGVMPEGLSGDGFEPRTSRKTERPVHQPTAPREHGSNTLGMKEIWRTFPSTESKAQ